MQLNSKYPHFGFCYTYYKSIDCRNVDKTKHDVYDPVFFIY